MAEQATGMASRLHRFGRLELRVAVTVCAAGLYYGFYMPGAAAAEPRWPEGTYKYITVDQPVSEALVEFGRNTGIPVRVGKEVRGRLSAAMPVGTARDFLEWVCQRYGLVWHFDGSALYVATEAEIQTEIIKVDAHAATGAKDKLDRLGVTEARFPIRVSEEDDVISVSGPPSYVALVKKTLGVSERRNYATDASGNRIVPVRVFRGKRAETPNVPTTVNPD